MRELRIKVPDGDAPRIVGLIRQLGVERVSVYREFVHGPDRWEEVISVETSTPESAKVLDAIQHRRLHRPSKQTITVRELRALAGSQHVRSLTVPLEVPQVDLVQDLWQFCQVTYGHLGRVAIASLLLVYGMIRGSLLLMAGGLLFLPALQHLLAVAQSICSRDRRLALQGVFALVSTIAVVVGCGAVIAAIVPEPMKFDDFLSPLPAACISVGIGIAGALASLDDVGKRELIGLATASQVGLVPSWTGISLVKGFNAEPTARFASYGVNLSLIVVTATIVYGLVRFRRRERSDRSIEAGGVPSLRAH